MCSYALNKITSADSSNGKENARTKEVNLCFVPLGTVASVPDVEGRVNKCPPSVIPGGPNMPSHGLSLRGETNNGKSNKTF